MPGTRSGIGRLLLLAAVAMALAGSSCHPRAAALTAARSILLDGPGFAERDAPSRAAALARVEALAMGSEGRSDAIGEEARLLAARILLEHLAAASFAWRVAGDEDMTAALAVTGLLAGILGHGGSGTLPSPAALTVEAESRIRALGESAALLSVREQAWRLRAISDAGGPLAKAAFLFLLERGAVALTKVAEAPLHADMLLAAHYPVFCPPATRGSTPSAVAGRAIITDACLNPCVVAQPDPGGRLPLELRRDLALATCGGEALGLPAGEPGAALGSYLSDETLMVQRHLADLLRRLDGALRGREPLLKRLEPVASTLRARVLEIRVPISYAFVTPALLGGAVPVGAPSAIVRLAGHVAVMASGEVRVGPRPAAGVDPAGALRMIGPETGAPFPGRPLDGEGLAKVLASEPARAAMKAGGGLLLMAPAAATGKALRPALVTLVRAGVAKLHLACETAFGPFPCAGAGVTLTPPPPAAEKGAEETTGNIDILADGTIRLVLPGAKPFTIGDKEKATVPAAVGAALHALLESVGKDTLIDGVRIRFADAVLYAGLLATVQAVAREVPRVSLGSEAP